MRELGRLSAGKVMHRFTHTSCRSFEAPIGLVNRSLNQLHKRRPDDVNLERAPRPQRGVAVTLWKSVVFSG
jgi:hypothetical protein